MHSRFATLLGLSLALVAGSLLFVALAQTPDKPTAEVPAARSAPTTPPVAPSPPAAPAVTAPTAPAPKPVVTAPIAPAPKPVVTAPTAPTPKPVVTAPTAPTPKSVVTAPAAPAPKPVVTAPTAPTPKPVVTAPTAPAPKPVVTAPTAPAPKPVVTAPTAPAPKPVVTAPTAPTSKPVVSVPAAEKPVEAIVNPPLPLRRPVISEMTIPAKALFARVKLPSIGPPRAIGYYPRGCLQGGIELPIDGPDWEVMRVARNRNWGHPELIRFIERFARLAAEATGWHGILIGDMAQPRGGPLPYGHLSHQIGLDVDVWYKPAPAHRLSIKQRNTISASNLVAPDGKHINKNWTPKEAAFIRIAAEQPEVERVLVNAAIKKKLCEMEGKHRYAWMDKVRPWYGHADHMHIRLKCPADSPLCRHQPPVPDSNQCGRALDYWFSERVLHPRPHKKPAKPHKPITLANMPAACKHVLNAAAKHTDLTAIEP